MDKKSTFHDASAERAGVRFAAWAAGGVIVLLVLAGYLLSSPITLVRLGEVAGVSGFLLIVFSLCLMVRLPGLAALAGGLESLYSLHRGVGLAGYGLVLLHPLLLATQGGWTVLELDGKDLGFRLGWTGLLILMVVLICTFVLKTAGYAIWRRLHMLSVFAFLAMAGHALAYQTDWPLPGQIAFDLFLLAGVLAPILRFWLVDSGRSSVLFRVDQVGHPAAEVVDMHLSPVGQALGIVPGQFVFASFQPAGDYPGCEHFHPFTASSVIEGGSLRLSIRANGPCTRQMQRIGPGGYARLQGPYGELFQHARQDSQIWVAGGIGITPFLARARMLDQADRPVRLFYFFDRQKDAVYLDELGALAREKPGLSFHPVEVKGEHETITAVFDALLPPWDDKHYVLCGSEGFVGFIRAYLIRHGVAPDAILHERCEFR